MAKVKTGPKVLAAILVIGGLVYGLNWYFRTHGETKMKSSVPEKTGELADFTEAESAPTTVGSITLPGTAPARMEAPRVKMLVIPWNAHAGINLANGGPVTTQGSLMEKFGVNMEIVRQDDYGKMQEALVSCANELYKGKKRCTTGANFVTIMGDAGPSFLEGLNSQLEKLGDDYKAEIVGFLGRSYGEDKFMAPPEVKNDPQNARGLLVAGVLKDGDWNIALFWAAENDICNNPDFTTYDPECLNWVSTSSFVEADEKYIQGACEERTVVRNGKKTGGTKTVCVNAVATWTPGDVAVATKKGGLVSVLSTRENSSQMACAVIGIRKWDRENNDTVVKPMLKAAWTAGDQIKVGGSKVLKRASESTAKIFREETAAWWMKYYRGVEEEDSQGFLIPLGGSRVFNLADNLRYIGEEPGSANAYAATYNTFGEIARQQYPDDLKSYPPVEEILNVTYSQEIAAEGLVPKGVADAPEFSDVPATGDTIAKRSWHITFQTGKADFGSAATEDLEQLLSALLVADNTVVEIHGHTDNVGSAKANQILSENRAFAVKKWLEERAPGNFPSGRIRVFAHGQTQPVASNSSAEGRAKNRRVDIVLKSQQ